MAFTFVLLFFIFIIFFGAFFNVIMVFMAISLITIGFYVFTSLFYFLMGQQAGCELAWLAFIPFGKSYLGFTLPHREFNLGLFKTKYRKRVFWGWFIAEICVGVVSTILSITLLVYGMSVADYSLAQPFSVLLEKPLFWILWLTSFILGELALLIRTIFHWRKNYDLLKTYEFNKLALPMSILNVFCPLIMIVFSILMAGRAPEYGSENYYFWEENGISYI